MSEHHNETLIRCPKCHKPMQLFERLLNPKTASYVRVFKCACGELVWDD